jgi:hypothetical protein
MKRIFIAMIVLAVLTGCGPADKTNKNLPKEEQAVIDQFKTVSENPAGHDMAYLLYINSLGEEEILTPTPTTPLPDMDEEEILKHFLGVNDEWPAEYLHPDMPPYPKGEINGCMPWEDDPYDLFILIKETSREDLDAYIEDLESNGFVENNGSYCKGLFTVEFQFNSSTVLQITSRKERVYSWPEDLMDIMPPLEKGDLIGFYYPEDGELYGSLYFINLTREDIQEWEKTLEDAGFTVSDGYYEITDVVYKGKTYSRFYAFIDSNGPNEYSLFYQFE